MNNDENRRQNNVLPLNDNLWKLKERTQENASRQTRMGYNNNQKKNRKFELNRNRAGGIRNPIQFNNTETGATKRKNRERQKKQNANRLLSTTTIKPIQFITTIKMNHEVPVNDLNTEEQLVKQRQRDDLERIRYEEDQRHEQEKINAMKLKEVQRQNEETKRRENHIREMEIRQKQFEKEEREKQENERINREKHRQDELRQWKNEQNRQQYESAQMQQMNLEKQRVEHQMDSQRAIQTNEIDQIVSTTESYEKQREKIKKRKEIRERIRKLSPEQQMEYMKRRAEAKSKKRESKQ